MQARALFDGAWLWFLGAAAEGVLAGRGIIEVDWLFLYSAAGYKVK